jgi:hypothetical protein
MRIAWLLLKRIGRGSYPKAKQGQGLQRTKKPIYPYEVEPVALLPAELKPIRGLVASEPPN